MLALMIGGLYGTFSDTGTSTGNKWTAGTLSLEVLANGTNDNASIVDMTVSPDTYPNSLNGHVEFGGVVPGTSGTIRWELTNEGSIDGTLTMGGVISGSEESEVAIEAAIPENNDSTPFPGGSGNGDLDNYLGVRLYDGASYVYGDAGYGTLAGLQTFLTTYNPALAHGVTLALTLDWQVADTVGNIIQSDSAGLDMTFTLTQV